MVTVVDLRADNGVVYVIDAVLLPPAQVDLPITFDDPGTPRPLDFGGNALLLWLTRLTGQYGRIPLNRQCRIVGGHHDGGDTLPMRCLADADTKMTVRVWSPGCRYAHSFESRGCYRPGYQRRNRSYHYGSWYLGKRRSLILAMKLPTPLPSTLPIRTTRFHLLQLWEPPVQMPAKTYWDDVEFGAKVTVVDIAEQPGPRNPETAVIQLSLPTT